MKIRASALWNIFLSSADYIIISYKENYKLYISEVIHHFSYLKTKKSYDRWVTRRVWGFRHQISKAKYFKMSVGNIRKLQENTAALYTERKTLRVGAIRGSGHVWPGKLKRPPLPSGCEISRCEISDQRIQTCLTRQNFGSEISARCKGDHLRVQGVGTPSPDDTERALLSGATPFRFPKRTRAAMLSGLL